MKLTNFSKQILFVAISGLIIAACSGGKHEGHETAAGDQMSATKAEEKPTAEIKVFEGVDPSVKSQINDFAVDYFALNKTLIEDNQDGARAAARKMMETVSGFDMSGLAGDQMSFYHTQLNSLLPALKRMSESADIEEARLELATVSTSMYALVKAYQSNNTELYYQFCPMARNGEGGNWLSETKEIVNPYMGQRMLKCGKTEEVIAQVK